MMSVVSDPGLPHDLPALLQPMLGLWTWSVAKFLAPRDKLVV